MGAKRKIAIANRSNTKKNVYSLTNNNKNNENTLSTKENKGTINAQSPIPTENYPPDNTCKGMKEIFKCVGTNHLFHHKKEQVPYDFLLVPRCFINKSVLNYTKNVDSFPLDIRPIISRNYGKQSYLSRLTDNNGFNKTIKEIAYDEIFSSDSCVWAPPTREDWDMCADEMTALCNTAMHFYWKKNQQLSRPLCSNNKRNKPHVGNFMSIPLTYIRDRIDIDDPMTGYQIRHRSGGWLQGFVMITPFTTWTCYFKWDSLHVKCGMYNHPNNTLNHAWDSTGSFSAELEKQPRSGDPHQGGVVWSTIAEISIVGGLGCGELLVRMALDEARRKGYDYAVLQATESSRSFYEKLGFCRVGAIARYLRNKQLRCVAGYRHWTYADEKDLAHHGKPSIMMALRIDSSWPPLLDLLSSHFVDSKPTIHKLSSTPAIGLQKDYRPDFVSSSPSKRIKLNPSSTSGRTISPDSVDISKVSQHEIMSNSPITCTNTNLSSKNVDQNPIDLVNYFKTEDKISYVSIPKNELRKQKITDLKRDNTKPSFFSKIVSLKKDPYKYFFVTNYDSQRNLLSLVALECVGFYKGNRDGRKKYKAKVESIVLKGGERVNIFKIFSVPFYDYGIIPADIVTKTNVVAKESWDIRD